MIRRRRNLDGTHTEVICTYANDFNGVIQWMEYTYETKTLLINYRLSDVVFMHYDVPKEAYEDLKKSADKRNDEEAADVKQFKEKYPGEAL